jgi:hypothetical protein
MQQLVFIRATIALGMLGLVFGTLAALHKSKDGSGLDLMWRELNVFKQLELYRPSKYEPRGRRYLYATYLIGVVQVILVLHFVFGIF